MRVTADIQAIKDRHDCRTWISQDLGKPQGKSQAYDLYSCPFHSDRKPSFAVYADHWFCYGCQKSGDLLTWLTEIRGLTFTDAVVLLNGGQPASAPAYQPPASTPRRDCPPEPPGQEWQQAARALVDKAATYLWSEKGVPALDWLRARGLTSRSIRAYCLGYIPGQRSQPYKVAGVGVVYPGWTIPWELGGNLWAVNVRRENVQPGERDDERGKYLVFQGSRRAGALFNADRLEQGKPVVFVEGEFDCILAAQIADDLVTPVTLGSATNKLHSAWYGQLVEARRLYLLLDNDAAGEQARQRLAALGERVRTVLIPQGKDLTDYALVQPGGIWDWFYESFVTTHKKDAL